MEQTSANTLSALPSSIAVATDLTDLDTLLPHAIAQAKKMKASISLIHALNLSDSLVLQHQESTDESDRLAASATLEAASRQIHQSGILCSIVLERGVAAEIALQAIRETRATHLILGTHAHGFAGQQILGHVANALLKTSPVPVYVVGPLAAGDLTHLIPSRILHPVSLGGNFEDSADFASQLAQAYGAELILLHVIDPSILRGSYVREILSEKNREMDALKARDQRGTPIRTIVSHGETIEEIFKVASATECDWIVMGIEKDFPWWSKTNNAAYLVISESRWPVVILREINEPEGWTQ